MKKILICCGLLFIFSAQYSCAQSIMGAWKRVSTTLTDKDGVEKDMQKSMARALPCAANITYTFLASGIQKTTVPEECQKKMAAMADMYADAQYELSGNNLKIISPKKLAIPDAAYKISFQGSSMTWTFDYAANTAVPNPTKAKKMVIVYEKI